MSTCRMQEPAWKQTERKCTMVFDQRADKWVGKGQTEPLMVKWKPEWVVSTQQIAAMEERDSRSKHR